MSTTPTITPPAAAPAPAAAPPTPAPTPAPAAPVPVSTPAAAAPAPSGPQPPAKLNPKEFANPTDAYMAEAAWRQQLADFKEKNPGAQIADDSPWPGEEKPAEATPGETAATAEAKPEEKSEEIAENATTQPTEESSIDDSPSLTPGALNDLIKAKPEREEFLKNDPELRGQLFKLSREHAELSQFKGIFPNKESAEFARNTAASSVSIRSAFQQAESPEQMAGAFDRFMQEFAVMGPDGKQAVDESGNPVYGDDLYMLGEHVVDRYVSNTLPEVEARIKANQYANDDERQRDQDMRIALNIIRGDIHPDDSSPAPDLSAIPENLRADYQRRMDELNQREAALDAQQKGKSKQTRVEERKQGNQKFLDESIKRTFDAVNSTIDTLRKTGVPIPDWMLKTTAPGSNTPVFYAKVGAGIQNLIDGDPYTKRAFTELEMRPPTPENVQERVKAYDRLLQQSDHRGVSNIRRIVLEIVRGHSAEQRAQAESQATPPTTAAPEPRSSGAPQPKILTKDDAYRMAEQQNAKAVQGWDNMSDSEKMGYNLTLASRLLSAKR